MMTQALTLKKIKQHLNDISQKSLSSMIIIEWSFIQKSIFLLLIMIALFVSYALYVALILLHPDLKQFTNEYSILLLWKDIIVVLIASAAIPFGYVWRSNARMNRYFPIFCIIFFEVSMCVASYCFGILSAATGVFLIGTPLIGLVLFPRNIILKMMIISLVSLIILTVVTNLGVMPYAPLFVNQELSGVRGYTTFYLYSQLYFTLPPLLFILFFMDILLKQWSQRERDLAMQSKLDSLTHLSNRYTINQHLERLAELSTATAEISTLLIGIDHIKHLRHTYGVSFSDELLQKIAKLLQQSMRNHDLAGRFDEDRLVVILSTANREVGQAVAERIRTRVESLSIFDGFGLEIQITASIGVATCIPFGMVGSDSILGQAEQALARAQQEGSNLIMHYDQLPITALQESDIILHP